jgi:hypothetical protein
VDRYELARRKYLPPPRITILFIAEAPPADPARFFYFENVISHDSLYLALMRALYSEARSMAAQELRAAKGDFLRRFQRDGYYLIDACQKPLPPRVGRKSRMQHLKEDLGALIGKLRSLAIANTPIVLVSKSVFDVVSGPLREEGFNVINSEMIDFPGSGRQAEFRRKMEILLTRLERRDTV